MQKHDAVRGNPNQRTLLTCAGFGIELKSHFRSDLL